ncbi:MAG: acetate uptake transporter [Halothiobacillus sp.]|jgi:succinate-acetate transporter protein|nr:acetate uptake transporter [Halothiobacillus sp.]
MQTQDAIKIADTTANPAPLGLMAFGMTTVLLNLHNAGFIAMDTMILAMGIFYGGIAQIIAGIMEWKKDNTFGTLAFISYGFFWLTLVALIIMPKMNVGVAATDAHALGAYLALWGVFTAILFVPTLRISRALQVVFATLTVLFFMLAAAELTGNGAIATYAGYVGIICGLSAMYAAMAQVWNEVYKREVAPLGAI